MHELEITKELIKNLSKQCETRGIKDPKTVVTRLGKLTTYARDSIIFYFDMLKKENELLANTKLVVEHENGKIRCNTCKKESYVQQPYLIECPYCYSDNVSIIEGRSFIIKSLEANN
ncbi:MAG: hydrogenase maturation nickel metallochaperone HypA [Candidatus Woesearchaeota archaeon]